MRLCLKRLEHKKEHLKYCMSVVFLSLKISVKYTYSALIHCVAAWRSPTEFLVGCYVFLVNAMALCASACDPVCVCVHCVSVGMCLCAFLYLCSLFIH